MTLFVSLLLLGLSISLYFQNQKIKKSFLIEMKSTKDFFDKEKALLEKQLKLEILFRFYIGDYFHNFGNNHWMTQEEKDSFILNKETCYYIQNIFTSIRYSSSRSDILVFNETMSLLNLSKELEEKLTNFFYELDSFDRQKLIYQIIIISMKKVLPEITNGEYGFREEEMFPKTIDDILNQKLAIWEKI